MTRFNLFLFTSLFLGVSIVSVGGIASSQTPQPSATPVETSAVAWRSDKLFERWREFQEKMIQYQYSRALFTYMEAHPPKAIQIEDRHILIDRTLDFHVHAVAVAPTRAREFPLRILSYLNGIGTTQRTLLFTWHNAQWQSRELPPVDLDQVQAAYYIPSQAESELLIITETCAFCSATGVRFGVWRWNKDDWGQVWQMGFHNSNQPHGEMILHDPTFETIQRRYSSWNRLDEKNFFHESNPGPHRYFVETWQREGDAYELIDTTTEQSAYNTLVEFSYAMNQEDWASAKRWAVDDEVIDHARALGYEQVGGLTYPPEEYYYPARGDCSVYTIEQCDLWNVDSQQGAKPHRFLVQLIKRGKEWFVSNIERRRK